jgi:hypothetical protein
LKAVIGCKNARLRRRPLHDKYKAAVLEGASAVEGKIFHRRGHREHRGREERIEG